MSLRSLSCALAGATLCLTAASGAHAQALGATTQFTGVSCHSGGNGTATVMPSGGSPGYTYSWAPYGGTAATATGLAAGVYTVTITDSTSASISRTVTVTQPAAALTATTTNTGVTTSGGSDGTATVSPAGGTAPYTNFWTPTGGNSQTASGLAEGTYTATVVDANGCFATATATIGVASAPPVAVPTLTEWAMIFLAGLLGLFGAARLGLLPAARKN